VKEDQEQEIRIPIDGTLDLHTFSPREVKDLVPDYLAACRREGITEVRIIHGKGRGALRRTVHAVLDRMEEVVSYRLAGDASSWGATVVTLNSPEEEKKEGDK
jgi:DNA-nicking Smr family endonuclease